jgi:hypothetical protein
MTTFLPTTKIPLHQHQQQEQQQQQIQQQYVLAIDK